MVESYCLVVLSRVVPRRTRLVVTSLINLHSIKTSRISSQQVLLHKGNAVAVRARGGTARAEHCHVRC